MEKASAGPEQAEKNTEKAAEMAKKPENSAQGKKKPEDSLQGERSIGTIVIDAFKIGGLPLATLVVGAITIVSSRLLPNNALSFLLVGFTIVVIGIFYSVWEQARQFGPFNEFNEQLKGYWWERISPDSTAAISFVQIEPYTTTGTLRLHGRVFDGNGKEIHEWDALDTCVNVSTSTLFYYWRGHDLGENGMEKHGFGEFVFRNLSQGKLNTARGRYSDLALAEHDKVPMKSTELVRVEPEEDVATMNSTDVDERKKVSGLVLRKITSWR